MRISDWSSDVCSSDLGLVLNILAFNVGVEIGQLLALGAILIAMGFWRRSDAFARQAFAANTVLMTADFMLIGYQLTGFFVSYFRGDSMSELHAQSQFIPSNGRYRKRVV